MSEENPRCEYTEDSADFLFSRTALNLQVSKVHFSNANVAVQMNGDAVKFSVVYADHEGQLRAMSFLVHADADEFAGVIQWVEIEEG